MPEKDKLYQIVKLFDCQTMPEHVKKDFFNKCQEWETHNDSIVTWYTTDHFCITLPKDYTEGNILYKGTLPNGITSYLIVEGTSITNDWLLKNGAVPNEAVYIKHWW